MKKLSIILLISFQNSFCALKAPSTLFPQSQSTLKSVRSIVKQAQANKQSRKEQFEENYQQFKNGKIENQSLVGSLAGLASRKELIKRTSKDIKEILKKNLDVKENRQYVYLKLLKKDLLDKNSITSIQIDRKYKIAKEKESIVKPIVREIKTNIKNLGLLNPKKTNNEIKTLKQEIKTTQDTINALAKSIKNTTLTNKEKSLIDSIKKNEENPQVNYSTMNERTLKSSLERTLFQKKERLQELLPQSSTLNTIAYGVRKIPKAVSNIKRSINKKLNSETSTQPIHTENIPSTNNRPESSTSDGNFQTPRNSLIETGNQSTSSKTESQPQNKEISTNRSPESQKRINEIKKQINEHESIILQHQGRLRLNLIDSLKNFSLETIKKNESEITRLKELLKKEENTSSITEKPHSNRNSTSSIASNESFKSLSTPYTSPRNSSSNFYSSRESLTSLYKTQPNSRPQSIADQTAN